MSLPPASQAADSVLDRDHFARQTFGDRDLQRELLALFAGQAAAIGAAVEAAALGDAGTHARVAAPLHTLCGSARAIGFWAVASAAERLDERLRQTGAQAEAETDRAVLMQAMRRALEACDALAAR